MQKIVHSCEHYYLCNQIYIYSNDNLLTVTIILLYFSEYLAAHKTKCKYVTQNKLLKCLKRHDNTTNPSYFIGCSEWKLNESHRFIKINKNVNLNLLRQLLDGIYEVNIINDFFDYCKLIK